MRPRKTLLLLARNDGELGLWRMRLETAGYRVVCALDLDELARGLNENPETAVVVSQWGSPDVARVLKGFHAVMIGAEAKLLLIDLPQSPDYVCDAIETSGPALVARVRERVKVLAARRRGPKRMAGRELAPAVFEAVPA
ncbi:hypothetical protein GOB94_13890 [Granulicella sp. 5B5]|uniref:hypothetical protein n=1 Tax=Granulicella sp. 5B5 TaxID=1617967 RepID=UPI0015F5015E|nr:hypothetical protein [Granulicella sp. 5B5]QMV19659.1 hypothetical protein GOB94_13890 [Granulicella sp. 5B5]